MGLDLRAEPPRINFCCVPHPPPPPQTCLVLDMYKNRCVSTLELNLRICNVIFILVLQQEGSLKYPEKDLSAVNPLYAPRGSLFISSPFEAERGGAYLIKKRRCYQSSIKWKSSSTRRFGSCSRESESNPNYQLVIKPSWISP